MVERGDVVLVAMEYTDTAGTSTIKRRPAVIVSADEPHRTRDEVLALPIISTRQSAYWCIPVKKDSEDGKSGGLRLNSYIDCSVIAAIPKDMLVATIGTFSEPLMLQVAERLRGRWT